MYCTADICGDFATQLFKIAALFYVKKKYNKHIILQNQNDFMLKSQLFINIPYDIKTFTFVTKLENIDILPTDSNIFLDIDFKTFNYFDNDILESMRFFVYSDENFMSIAYDRYSKIKQNFNCEDDDIVSVYIDDCANYNYYNKAIHYIEKKNVVIFISDPEINLSFIEKADYNFHIIYENNIIIQFILLSFFQFNIINYTSPIYSMWAMYISKYKDVKKCILPSHIKQLVNYIDFNNIQYKFIT